MYIYTRLQTRVLYLKCDFHVYMYIYVYIHMHICAQHTCTKNTCVCMYINVDACTNHICTCTPFSRLLPFKLKFDFADLASQYKHEA